jgi:hypothetical protein
MPAKRLIRVLILVQIPVLLAIGVAAYLSGPSLPESLRYLINRELPGANVFEAGGVLVFLIASICVFVFWSGAPALYLTVTAGLQLASFVLGPFVSTGWTDVFETSATLLNGVILGLIYFSPAKELFKQREPAGEPGFRQAVAPQFTAVEMPVQPPASGHAALFCGACGARGQGGKFCPDCGKPLVVKNQCRRCGAELKSGKKFCGECGAPAA